MKIQELNLICLKCEHAFVGEIVVMCSVRLAVVSMRELRCPKCYSRKVAQQLDPKAGR